MSRPEIEHQLLLADGVVQMQRPTLVVSDRRHYGIAEIMDGASLGNGSTADTLLELGFDLVSETGALVADHCLCRQRLLEAQQFTQMCMACDYQVHARYRH
jgi:hypothetical protein